MKKNSLIKLLIILSIVLNTALFAKNSSEEVLKKAEKNLPSQCLFYFKMYLNAKEPKAFAYAIDSPKEVTCRFSAHSNTQKRANEVALASCKKSKEEKGIKAACKLYKIDGTISKSQKQLAFEKKYLLNLNQIRKIKEPKVKKTEKTEKVTIQKKAKVIKDKLTILPKPCLMFYHLYEEASQHKAFAIAIDNKKHYTCKYSAGSTSKQKAQEVALASCEKMRETRKIKAICQLFTKKEGVIQTKFSPKPKVIKNKKVTPKKPQAKSETLKQVLKKRQAQTVKSHKQNAALQKAILNADLKKIKALIKKGADINVQAKDKSRAIFVAVAQGDIAFTKALLKKGAFAFVKKRDGNNLLVAAIMSGSNKMLTLMLKQHIDPNIRCEDGNTPLHFALMMFDDKMMKTLYKYKARDDIKNKKGKSVRELAKELHIDLKRIKH